MALRRSAVALPLAVVVIAALAGCVQSPGTVATPLPTPVPSSSSTAAGVPTYNPTGTASDNLAYFNQVGGELFASSQAGAASTQGVLIVNWFVAHGFNKKNMEVTPDKTSIGLAAWNIDFSVRFGKTCILGQAGNVGFQSSTVPILATGKCLIGQTRTIDW
ncbi:MAG: hypothetical protein QOH69_213 [Actinomycetota bacterium]|nr:hypothetical protein [Actinomycetota bacterium]